MFVKQNFLDFWTYWYWASARAVPVSARLLVSAILSWKARIKLALTTHGAIATAKARTVNLQVLRYVDVVGIKVNLRQKETVKLQWFKEFVRLQLHGNLRIYLIHSVSSHLKVQRCHPVLSPDSLGLKTSHGHHHQATATKGLEGIRTCLASDSAQPMKWIPHVSFNQHVSSFECWTVYHAMVYINWSCVRLCEVGKKPCWLLQYPLPGLSSVLVPIRFYTNCTWINRHQHYFGGFFSWSSFWGSIATGTAGVFNKVFWWTKVVVFRSVSS